MHAGASHRRLCLLILVRNAGRGKEIESTSMMLANRH
jgi:hypothetical protein